MSVIFIFVDGIGVGPGGNYNPLDDPKWTVFKEFTGSDGLHDECKTNQTNNVLYKPIDANLGVHGLPQSGTGQVTLFSGKNASKEIGKHFGPFPHSKTKKFLKNGSLFHRVKDLQKSPHFLNAYPDIFFERAEQRNRWTATTLMVKSTDIRLNSVSDVMEGRAVTAEIKQNIWRERLNLDVPEITEEAAADRVLKAAEIHDLVLYEFYLTDKAGHKMDHAYADEIRDVLNPFLLHIIKNLSDDDTFVLTSDHGNLEDLRIKTHTRNPVPLLVKGEVEYFKDVESILDVTPSIVNHLQNR